MTTPRADHRLVASEARNSDSQWYALLAPPAAWAIQEWLGWYFGQRSCSTMESSRWILLAVSVAALAAALVGVRRGWRSWRETAGDSDHRERVDFLGFGGLLVSGVFAVAIVWAGLAMAFLSGCGWMR